MGLEIPWSALCSILFVPEKMQLEVSCFFAFNCTKNLIVMSGWSLVLAFVLSFCRVHCFPYHLQFTEKSICVWFCKQGCILCEFLKREARQSLLIYHDLRISEAQNCLGGKEPLEIILFIQTLCGSGRIISIMWSRTMSSQILNIYTDGGCWLPIQKIIFICTHWDWVNIILM